MSVDPRSFAPRVDVRRMYVLREVARAGSIGDAADALHFTASAVSQQIRVLEEEAGVRLLERGPCSVSLNAAGKALVAHTDFIIQELELAEEHLRAIASLKCGRLRLATFRSAGEAFVAEAVMYFANRYPRVDLQLREGEPEQYLPLLKQNELDLALGFEYDFVATAPTDGVQLVELFEEPMLIAMPAGHPLSEREGVELSRLEGEAWITSTPRSAVHAFTRRACEAAGVAPTVVYETDDYHVAQAFVARGLGVTFLPAISVNVAHPGVVVHHVEPEQPMRRVFVAHRPDGERLPTVAAMLDVLRELSSDLPMTHADLRAVR